MPKQEINIESILGGYSITKYQASKEAIDSSIGIDPDLPLTSSSVKTSGMVVPSQYADVSGANVNSPVMWLVTTPKGETVYAYLANGRLIEYDANIENENLIATVSNSSGNGAAYYNNYLYLSGNTDIARYGPLDGSATLVDGVWTGSTLGSQTQLQDKTYPSLRAVEIPNHPMYVHGDGALYVGDFVGGQGVLHKIVTSKTTSEGDTDDGSAYNVLDLPFGFAPTALDSFGLNVVVLANQTTSDDLKQGKSALFFWDAVNADSFQKGPLYLPDVLGTALLNVNGVLRIFSGNAQNGVRISKYIGGDNIIDRDTDNDFLEDSLPPFSGAVDNFGSRGVWGGFTTYPENSASVWALGSKKAKVPMGVHNIVRATSTDTDNQTVTAVRFIQQETTAPKVLVGWRDDTTVGIDAQQADATINAVWRTQVYNVGKKFQIKGMRIPLGVELGESMEIVPTVYLDDESSSSVLRTINSTNYQGRKAIYREPELAHLIGENNFFIEFSHGGTAVCPQLLPIRIMLETWDEE